MSNQQPPPSDPERPEEPYGQEPPYGQQPPYGQPYGEQQQPYGAPGYGPPGGYGSPGGYGGPPPVDPGRTMGIVGLVLSGSGALFTLLCSVGIILAIPGVIVSAIGWSKSRSSGFKNGVALAGIIVGGAAAALSLISLIVFGLNMRDLTG